ncbi:MAG: hypothetical protein MJA29_01915, partial [Candidatus Omnitrophica bacterium]|nr:hypothetical protein [Candidatus Omnitrophota bacterium]
MNKKAAVKIGVAGILAVLFLVCMGSGGWRYAGAAEKDPIEISDEIDSWYHEALILYQKGKQRAARDKLDYIRNTLESNYMVQLWRQNTNARPTIEDVNGLIKDIDAYLDQEEQRRLGLIRETEMHKEEVRARKLAAREVARREREEARKRRQEELAAQKKARERERAMRSSKQEAERKAREALLAQKRQEQLAEQAERRQEEETRKQKRLEEIARQKAEKEARKQALRAQREERRRAKEEELARKREERMKEKEMLLARREAEREARREEKQRLREERLKERERIREQKEQARRAREEELARLREERRKEQERLREQQELARQAKEEELARIREERRKEQEARRAQKEQERLARREERARLIEQKRLAEEREQAEREARRQERLAKLAEERAARQEEIENLREHQKMLKEQRRQEQEKYERELARQKDEQRQKEKELRLAKKEAREKSEQIGDLDKEVRNLERAVAEMKQSSPAKQQRAIIRIDDMSKEIHYQKLRIKDMEQSERLREREARVQAREQALKREEERLARLQSGQERQLAKQPVGREKKPVKEEVPPAQLKEQQVESKPPAVSEAEARKLALLREKEELRQARLQAKEEARKVRIEEEAARREEARQIKEKRRLEKEKQRQEVLAKRQARHLRRQEERLAREEAKRKEKELARQRKEEERLAREEAKRKEQELAQQRKEEERVALAAARRREEMARAASQQKHVEDAAKVAKIEKIWKESLRLYKLGMFEEAVQGFQEVVVLEGNPRIKYTPEAKRLIEEAEQKIIERDQAKKKLATINEVENVEREMLQEVLNRQVAPYVEPPQKQVALNEDTLIEPPVIRKKLARKRVTMDFDKVSLKSVMRFLSQESGINYVASQKVLNLDPVVTARFTDATLEEVTKYVTKSLGLVYRIDKEVIWIADPEEIANEPMETRVYYLRKGGGLFTEFSPVSGGGDTGLGGSSASVNKIYTIEDTLKEMIPWPGDAKLTYDKRLNALIVRNTPQNLQMMEDILYNLDIEPCQILIEARFIEVDVTDINDLGLEWTLPADFATDKKDGALKMGIGSGSGIDFSDFTRAAEGLNFTYKGVLTEPQFNVVLHALEESKKIKTLSSPRITTLNNQMASIKVVDEWIYPTRYEFEVVQSDVNGDGDFNDAGETVYKNVPKDFLRRDVGILLKVIPAVGADRRTVSLSLIPEVSEATADAF